MLSDTNIPWGTEPKLAPKPPVPSVIDEAREITHGDRRASYGHPLDNHTRTAVFWSALLGREITPEQVCMMNILQKMARAMHDPTERDTYVDIIGYAANIDMIQTERIKRAAEAYPQ